MELGVVVLNNFSLLETNKWWGLNNELPLLIVNWKTMGFAKVESLTPLDIEASSMPLLSPTGTTAKKNSTSKNIFLWYVFSNHEAKSKMLPISQSLPRWIEPLSWYGHDHPLKQLILSYHIDRKDLLPAYYSVIVQLERKLRRVIVFSYFILYKITEHDIIGWGEILLW